MLSPSIHCSGQTIDPTDAPLASALGLSQPDNIQHVSPILAMPFQDLALALCTVLKIYRSGPHLPQEAWRGVDQIHVQLSHCP